MKYIWPILILLFASTVTALLIWLRPDPDVGEPEAYVPEVEYVEVETQRVTLQVKAQGTVEPRTETALTAEVGGRILRVADAFANGGFFAAGDVLLEIDPLPYENELAQARSNLASARLALAQEQAQADQARREWESYRDSPPTPLVLRQPQIEKAQADIAAAETALRIAERNQDRTRVRAPYDGRVRAKQVDVGQVTAPNSTVLAQIYATDYAEVRLPLSLKQYSLLALSTGPAGNATDPSLARFFAATGRVNDQWQGRIVRTEGSIDPRNRMIHVIARIDDPFRRQAENSGPLLQIGRFVEAKIEGRTIENAFVIPRAALIHPDTVRVINADNRLVSREVSIVQTTEERVIIDGGLEDGDRVNLTPIQYFVENMEVAP